MSIIEILGMAVLAYLTLRFLPHIIMFVIKTVVVLLVAYVLISLLLPGSVPTHIPTQGTPNVEKPFALL